MTTTYARLSRASASVLASLCITGLCAQNLSNPVLEGIADAGVMKYAGKYYLGGVSTYGDFFVSDNLTEWNRRIHVFDLDNDWTRGTGARNNQVHADDITYSGGLFHLLFSVNYWGDDRHIVHITRATSPSISGPFEEVRKDQWFENRIDPQVFCDEDGRLYLYMVKFTDGNTIWARPMNSDFSFAGDAVQQFSSQPGTWETMDNRVAEGPFVIKYRGRYYMMYNANHTAPEYGNYRLGVCEAASPMAFGPGGKYPWPVVGPDTEALDDDNIDLIVYGADTFRPVSLDADTIRFRIDRDLNGRPYMKLAQRGGCEVALNGHTVNPDSKSDYRLIPIDRRLIRKGENVITVRRKGNSSRLVGLAIYDMTDHRAGDLMLTPGQPSIVRGPNGWEWWLVYMANKAWKRNQHIDRIHFTGGRLYVDGITSPYSKGFHPVPAMPRHSGKNLDGVTVSDAYLLEVTFAAHSPAQSVSIGGKSVSLPPQMSREAAHVWRIERNHGMLTVWIDNVLVCDHEHIDKDNRAADISGNVEYLSYNEGYDEYARHFSGWDGLKADDGGLILGRSDVMKGDAATSYELSVQFDNATPDRGRYGLYAAWQDADNYVRVTIDAARRSLITEHCVKGRTTTSETPLSHTSVHYPDIKYTDSFEKQYRFDSDTYVSSILLPRLDADNDPYARSLSLDEHAQRKFRDDMASLMDFSWLDGDTWRKIEYKTVGSGHPGWQKITFPTVRTRALRMINSNPHDNNRNIYRIKTCRDFAATCQLRVDRRGKSIHIFADNRELATVSLKKNVPARTGLHSDGAADLRAANVLYYVVSEAR